MIYRKIKADIGGILRQLCERKGVEIIEATACPDHIHMLVRTTKIKCVIIYGLHKREKYFNDFQSSLNLKYRYGNRHFCVEDIM